MGLFRKKSEVKINTFTKVWVNRTLILSWICIFLCFILAALGREQIAENLAVAIVMNIVGVFVGYFAKSFFETREEKRMEAHLIEPTPVDPSTKEGMGVDLDEGEDLSADPVVFNELDN